MFEFKDLDRFIATLDKWEADVEETITEVARGYAAQAFHTLLDWSPQYSGDFAANWNYRINSPDYGFVPGLVPQRDLTLQEHHENEYRTFKKNTLFHMLSPEAIEVALSRNAGKDDGFQLGDTVFMCNSASHDEPYAMMIETNQIRFRPGNSGATVARTAAAMQAFSSIGQSTAESLMVRRV